MRLQNISCFVEVKHSSLYSSKQILRTEDSSELKFTLKEWMHTFHIHLFIVY